MLEFHAISLFSNNRSVFFPLYHNMKVFLLQASEKESFLAVIKYFFLFCNIFLFSGVYIVKAKIKMEERL